MAYATRLKELVVWGVGNSAEDKGQEAVIREFERRNPDIKVRMLSLGAGAMNPQKLMTAIVGKSPPDVIRQDRFTISDWASRGAFEPLDPLIQRDEKSDPDCPTREQYFPSTWDECVYGGKTYGIPEKVDNRMLYWNRDVFRKNADRLLAAGLDPNRAPRTWTELKAYSKALTIFNPDGTLKQAGFYPHILGNATLYLYAFQNNAQLISPDGRRCTLATKQAAEALQLIKDGFDILGGYDNAIRFASGFGGEANDPFISGKVAMKIDGDWIVYGLAKFGPTLDFAVAPPPVPDDRFYRKGRFVNEKETFISWGGGFCFAIPRGAKLKEEAWKFIKWVLSTDGRVLDVSAQVEWVRRKGRLLIPNIPAQVEAAKQVFSRFMPPGARFAEAKQAHIDLMPHTKMRPSTFAGQPLWDESNRAIDNVLFKHMAPMDALNEGQAVVQRELDYVFEQEKYPKIDMRIPAALGAVGGMLALAVLFFTYRGQKLKTLARSEARWGYWFTAPWLIGFVAFTLGPMVASLFFSFTQYNVLSDARWVGWKNYADLVTQDGGRLGLAFQNVLYIAGIGIPLGLLTSISIALLLNAAVRGIRYYRTFFYLPSIVPGIASAVLWKWLLTPATDRGLINAIWAGTVTHWFGTQPPGWLQVEAWAKPALIFMGLWGAGGGAILWLAGLKGVPTTLYEAASIDGANDRSQFWNITVPQLSPIVFFTLVMGVIGTLQMFDNVYVVYDGGAGPSDAAITPVYHLFVSGFRYFKMGPASALAWVVFAIILVLTLIQLKIAPRWVHHEVEL